MGRVLGRDNQYPHGRVIPCDNVVWASWAELGRVRGDDPARINDMALGRVLGRFLGRVWPRSCHFLGRGIFNSVQRIELYGAGDRNRTGDPVITSDVLYQLSYTSSVFFAASATSIPGEPRADRYSRVAACAAALVAVKMVRPPRIELGTPAFSVRCSTN